MKSMRIEDFVIFLLLFILFAVLFGAPSLQKYLTKDTFTVDTKVEFDTTNPPAVTICATNPRQGNGWKPPLTVEELFHGLDVYCNYSNDTLDALECLKRNTYGLNETIDKADIYLKKDLLLSSYWDTDITSFAAGQCHTLNNSYTIGTDRKHMLRIFLSQNKSFHVMIHDPQLTTLNFNPETFPEAKLILNENSGLRLLYIKAISHVNLRTRMNPCEESADYSFKACVKNSFSRKVGCRLPWDKWTEPTLPKCTELDQLRRVDQHFHDSLYISKEMFATNTGCHFPCKFMEYEQVGQPTIFNQNQLGLLLLMTSTEITEKTETVVYPFESFLAEFGGALGLFLGFSFLACFDMLKIGVEMMLHCRHEKSRVRVCTAHRNLSRNFGNFYSNNESKVTSCE